MRTPTEFSPYFLIQEALRNEPWKLLVACACLNLTSARQVHGLINGLFDRWPTPESMAAANRTELAEYIRPLGLAERRSKNLVSLSQAFIRGGWNDPEELPGVGKYAGDSYRMFVGGNIVDDVQDEKLKKYIEWARKRAGEDT